MICTLERVNSKKDWVDYHAIRSAELFADYVEYDSNHPDEFVADNHPLLMKTDCESVATVRLDFIGRSQAIMRLLAVTRSAQAKGYGRKLCELIIDYATSRGVTRLLVNANPEAIGFYRNVGFVEESWDVSELKGIAADCVQMSKVIRSSVRPDL